MQSPHRSIPNIPASADTWYLPTRIYPQTHRQLPESVLPPLLDWQEVTVIAPRSRLPSPSIVCCLWVIGTFVHFRCNRQSRLFLVSQELWLIMKLVCTLFEKSRAELFNFISLFIPNVRQSKSSKSENSFE